MGYLPPAFGSATGEVITARAIQDGLSIELGIPDTRGEMVGKVETGMKFGEGSDLDQLNQKSYACGLGEKKGKFEGK